MARWDGSTGLPKGLVQIMRTWGGGVGSPPCESISLGGQVIGGYSQKSGCNPKGATHGDGNQLRGDVFPAGPAEQLEAAKKK